MFAKICGNVCKESFFACLLISPETWFGVYHFADVSKMIGKKSGGHYRSNVPARMVVCYQVATMSMVPPRASAMA